jgi:Concanavalin A-like lectin/glucanases superfamily
VLSVNPWTNSPDTQFAIFPQAGATYTGSGFCAFHSVTMSGGYIYDMQPYLNDPNFPTSGACLTAYGNGSFPVAMNTVLSHEYAEAATDPQANGSGWVQAGTLTEIGDLCASSVGVARVVFGASVQLLWDNITDRCATYSASSYVTAVQGDGPSAYYRLGENFSGALVPLATNSALPSVNPSNNGTYSSAVTQNVSGGIVGDPDTAASFPSSGASVSATGSGLPAGASARTVEAWFQTSVATASQSILAYGSQSSTNYFMVSLESNGTDIHIAGWFDNIDFTATPTLADGKWHYLVVTYNGATAITVYVDGQFLSQGNLATPLNTTVPGSGLSVGNAYDGNFAGNLDEVAIYPTALTQTQITSHFQAHGGWELLTPAAAPAARFGNAIAYHNPSSRTILFGGAVSVNGTSTYFGDTWRWDGVNWTQLTPANSPSPRTGATMVYDAATSSLVLFGGGSVSGGVTTYFGDTWNWNGTNWAQVTQPHGSKWPSGRSGAAMAYDAARGVVVMFGGVTYPDRNNNPVYLNDTWTFNGSTWTQASPTSSPSIRVSSMAYDTVHSDTVLFGGYYRAPQTGNYYNDTWIWNGSNWVSQTPATSPSTRQTFLTYDAGLSTGAVVLFGGSSPGPQGGNFYDSDTWSWDGSNWHQLQESVWPSARISEIAYSAGSKNVVLFGGVSSPLLSFDTTWYNDTWTLN